MKSLRALPESGRDMRSVVGGLLVQDTDSSDIPELEHRVVTERPPSKDEIEAMEFGWKVVKHVKSKRHRLRGQGPHAGSRARGRCPGWIPPGSRCGRRRKRAFR